MKKAVTFLLTLLMMFTLASCGDAEEVVYMSPNMTPKPIVRDVLMRVPEYYLDPPFLTNNPISSSDSSTWPSLWVGEDSPIVAPEGFSVYMFSKDDVTYPYIAPSDFSAFEIRSAQRNELVYHGGTTTYSAWLKGDSTITPNFDAYNLITEDSGLQYVFTEDGFIVYIEYTYADGVTLSVMVRSEDGVSIDVAKAIVAAYGYTWVTGGEVE